VSYLWTKRTPKVARETHHNLLAHRDGASIEATMPISASLTTNADSGEQCRFDQKRNERLFDISWITPRYHKWYTERRRGSDAVSAVLGRDTGYVESP